MIAQIINITFPGVAEYYQKKYNHKALTYNSDEKALEIRHLQAQSCKKLSEELSPYFRDCLFTNETEDSGILIIASGQRLQQVADPSLISDLSISEKLSSIVRSLTGVHVSGMGFLKTYNASNEPLIMGILNVTPDSFSDGGMYFSEENAIAHAMEMISTGADIIDIGGESTRPGAEFVSAEEQLRRLLPVIEKILEKSPGTILSIDTTNRLVAYEALKRGARIVNDVSGLTREPELASVVKEFGAALVIMHMKGTPKNMQVNPYYGNVVEEVFDFLKLQSDKAKAAGVKDIIIDPGIGFGKRVSDNYELLGRLDEFKCIGAPVLIGLSRKSFLGKSLELDITSRDTATVIAETQAIRNGANIIRTHNVKNALQAKKILSFFTNPEKVVSNV